MPAWIPAAIGAVAGLVGQKRANVASAQQAQQQMAFQERMSSTAHQRAMSDLNKAGLNPILAAQKPASSPGGAMAPQLNMTSNAVQIGQGIAQIQKTLEETRKLGLDANIGEDYGRLWDWFFDSSNWFNKDNYTFKNMFPAFYNNNSASDVKSDEKKKLNEHKIYTVPDKKRGTFTESDIKVPKRKSRIFYDPITGRNYTLTTHGRYTYVD